MDPTGTEAGEVRPEIQQFFDAWSAVNDRDPVASAEFFCDQFLNLDPNSIAPVTRAQLAAVLPRRAGMFASIGSQGMTLVELSEDPIDAMHTLARAVWHVRFEGPDTEPLTLRSSFLLRREPHGWRIAVYLNHADIGAVIRERQEAGDPQR